MGIVISTHLPPPVDDGQHRCPQMGDPHVVLKPGHVLFGSGLLGERPGQHEFGLEHASVFFTIPSRVAAIQGIAECLTRRCTLRRGRSDPCCAGTRLY